MMEMRPLATALALGAAVLASGAGDAGAQGTLRVAPPNEIISLEPQGPHRLVSSPVTAMQHIYDPLLIFDGDVAVPRLATSWSQPDPLTWVFELREDVTFHNGDAFTAKDVKASLDRLRNQSGSLPKNFRSVESVETDGDHTVVITTSEPFGALLRTLSLTHIAPASELAQLPESGENTAGIRFSGTRAFELEDFATGERVSLVANDDYWDGRPAIDRLEFVNIPEVASRVTALTNDEIDFAWELPEDVMTELGADPAVTIEALPSVVYYFIWMQEQREPFDDLRVRRAMWHGVDWEKLINDLCPTAHTAPHRRRADPVF